MNILFTALYFISYKTSINYIQKSKFTFKDQKRNDNFLKQINILLVVLYFCNYETLINYV